MSIKTYRDIRNSLDIARKQFVPSITSRIEESLKEELEKEFGPILTEEERSGIVTREKERKEKQDAAITKSRLKILKVKEIARETQMIRDALHEGKIPDSHVDSGSKKVKKQGEAGNSHDAEEFKTMNIRY